MEELAAPPTTRQTLLQAARQVVLDHGVAALTLEAVARAAGVSKGGLLYHFPTKEALIAGMIGQLIEATEANIRREYERDPAPDAPGRRLRAYLRDAFADCESLPLQAGLLAAVAANPALLAPLRACFADRQRQIEDDGLDPARATLIRLAADGLWLGELLGLAPPAGPLRERTLAALLALTDDGRAKSED